MPTTKPCSVYFLCDSKRCRSYVGYTTHVERRLRQHKGLIKGGARWTASWKGDVHLISYVTGFQTSRQAMSFEWWAKRYTHHPFPIIRLHDASKPVHSRWFKYCSALLHAKFRNVPLTLHLVCPNTHMYYDQLIRVLSAGMSVFVKN